MELADGGDAGSGEFADRNRAVSPFGPSANEGIKSRDQENKGQEWIDMCSTCNYA
jgi:hypothetical protein